MSRQFKSLAQSTLASGYTSGGTTVTLTSGGGAFFPSAGNFTVALGSLINRSTTMLFKVTSRSGDVLTGVGAQEGSSAQSYIAGDLVTLVLTEETIADLRLDMSRYAAVAGGYPTDGATGDFLCASDDQFIYRYSGSAWVPIALKPVGALLGVVPLSGAFTWLNQDSSVATDSISGFKLARAAGGGDTVRGLAKAMPTPTSPLTTRTLTVGFRPRFDPGQNYAFLGLIICDSGTTPKLHYYNFCRNNATCLKVYNWGSPTSLSASPYTVTVQPLMPDLLFMRIVDNGTNLIFSRSFDNGLTWTTDYTIARLNFLAAPAQWGVALNSIGSQVADLEMSIVSWLVS